MRPKGLPNKILFGNLAGTLKEGLDTADIGEHRWCMNVTKVLLDAGFEIYSPPNQGIWKTDLPKPKGFFPEQMPEGDDYIFISYNPFLTPPPKGIPRITCRFERWGTYEKHGGFWHTADKEVVVHTYPTGLRFDGLRAQVKGPFRFLPNPVEIPPFEDRFPNTHLLWSTKGGFGGGSRGTVIDHTLIQWIAKEMKRDNRLTLTLVAMTHGKSYPASEQDMRQHAIYRQHLAQFGDRVQPRGYISYGELKELLEKTKMLINPGCFGHTLGGSTVEAAAASIPSIQLPQNPFMLMPGVVQIPPQPGEWILKLDHLFNNAEFYRNKAKAYHNYAKNTYSKENFLKVFYDIASKHLI